MPTDDIVVDTVRPQDIARLYQISSEVHRASYADLIPNSHKDKFLDHYQLTEQNRQRYIKAVKRRLKDLSYSILVARSVDDTVVGYLSIERKNGEQEIRSVFVDPIMQGHGIGSKLMKAAIIKFGNTPINLYVIKGNNGALSLYQKFDFTVVESADKTFYGALMLHMRREPTAKVDA